MIHPIRGAIQTRSPAAANSFVHLTNLRRLADLAEPFPADWQQPRARQPPAQFHGTPASRQAHRNAHRQATHRLDGLPTTPKSYHRTRPDSNQSSEFRVVLADGRSPRRTRCDCLTPANPECRSSFGEPTRPQALPAALPKRSAFRRNRSRRRRPLQTHQRHCSGTNLLPGA